MIQLEVIKEAVKIIERFPKDTDVIREQLYIIEKSVREIRNTVR